LLLDAADFLFFLRFVKLMTAPVEVDLLTLFPEMVQGYFSCSMLGRAEKNGLLSVRVHNIRDWAVDKHHVTDDRPFGGGAGMVMKPEPLVAAIEALRREGTKVVYLSPDGVLLKRPVAESLALVPHLILLSGHYEGIDQRVRDHWVDLELSIGDYVLTNGTLAAAVVIDCLARFIPGVLGEPDSVKDAFTNELLGSPQYTRPVEFRGHRVPDVLLNGHHAEISKWRHSEQTRKTIERRPDLLQT
jgi:tRNA (guanine37-N1)-methyltransferase